MFRNDLINGYSATGIVHVRPCGSMSDLAILVAMFVPLLSMVEKNMNQRWFRPVLSVLETAILFESPLRRIIFVAQVFGCE